MLELVTNITAFLGTIKALLSPSGGAYLISDLLEGGLIEGARIHKIK